ncbi:MAG TPA: vanadium-dependent haloperoxidase [Polyangia bacterium]|jgi:hypothetical protein|nr:vanadium-dependent haloperoxidase [Polyangia bacterium]
MNVWAARRVRAVAILISVFSFGALGADSAAVAGENFSGAVVRAWNDVAISTVRIKSASDAQAARLYAMVDAAIYDAVNGIASRHSGPGNDRRHALVPPSGAPPHGHPVAAAAAAAHAVLVGIYPDQAAVFDSQLAADLAPLQPNSRVSAGQAWGAAVGAAVLTARAADGSSPAETQPAGTGPGVFRAAWSGVQFRNLAPFAIANPAVYVGAGPPSLTSLDYAAAFAEIYLLGNAAIPDADKLATYNYWSLGGGTSQPPGAWLQVARAVSSSLDLERTARLFALVSMALADTVAPTYMTKFIFRFWRPTTAIREADTDGNPNTNPDVNWSARAGTVGGTPEYWSGHSSFSAAAATILAGFFCNDDIPFTLVTDSAPGGLARSYPSFSAAAAEAGRSRVVGGIHFEIDGNQEGLRAGRAIGSEVLKTSLLLKKGMTHFGACPL